jgi:hypothetical protein
MGKNGQSLLLLLLICFAQKAYAQINIDLFVGTIVDKNILDFEEGNDTLSFKSINCSIEYQLWNNLGLGIYLGYLYNSKIQHGAAEQNFLPLAYPINYGVKTIIGNINKGLAVALNIGINPTIGIYFKNCLVNAGWGYSTVVDENIYDKSGNLLSSATKNYFYPYIEIGYSVAVR